MIDPIPSCSGMDRLANQSLRGNSYEGRTGIDPIDKTEKCFFPPGFVYNFLIITFFSSFTTDLKSESNSVVF
jgi:hypothetical protein